MKALASKYDDLSSIPRSYMMEGEAGSGEVSSDLHMYVVTHMCPYVHTQAIN